MTVIPHHETKELFLPVTGEQEHAFELEAGARLTLLAAAEPAAKLLLRLSLAEGAVAHTTLVSAAAASFDVNVKLCGAHARSDINGAFLLPEGAKAQARVLNDFRAAHGRGEILLKTVAHKNTHAKVHGTVRIGEGGAGTDTYLTEDALLLDSSAKVDAVPALEIHCNDVKASHSARLHRLTPEELFYFAARGMDTQLARELSLHGFLGDVLDRIPSDALRHSFTPPWG